MLEELLKKSFGCASRMSKGLDPRDEPGWQPDVNARKHRHSDTQKFGCRLSDLRVCSCGLRIPDFKSSTALVG